MKRGMNWKTIYGVHLIPAIPAPHDTPPRLDPPPTSRRKFDRPILTWNSHRARPTKKSGRRTADCYGRTIPTAFTTTRNVLKRPRRLSIG